MNGGETQPLLAIGGARGIIKVLNCASRTTQVTLLGHGNSINDLHFHPVQRDVLLQRRGEAAQRTSGPDGGRTTIPQGHAVLARQARLRNLERFGGWNRTMVFCRWYQSYNVAKTGCLELPNPPLYRQYR